MLRRVGAARRRSARPGCRPGASAHTGRVPTPNKFPLSAVLLVGIGLIATIFGISYMRARSSDRGTSFDDSPAAEVGAAPEPR